MRFLITLLLTLALLLSSSMKTEALKDTSTFVAVICSHDLLDEWTMYKSMDTDYLIDPNTWDELDAVLDDIAIKSQGQPIFLDFCVHGDNEGLQIRWDERMTSYDNASMGYVLNHVRDHLSGHAAMVCFESCFAGRAYKYTIRGAKTARSEDNVEDFVGIPSFGVYGTGDAFSVIGQPMYLQYRHNFRNWWVDLRDYDALGKNRIVLPKEREHKLLGSQLLSDTTYEIYTVVHFFRYGIRN